MTATAPYDDQNVFAKILRGEMPCHKVLEDEHVLAFMDIMPRAPGHSLIIPKAPCRNLLDCPPEYLSAVHAGAQRIAKAAISAFGADGVTIQQFNEDAGGQEVFHYHVHVIPRVTGQRMGPPGVMGNMEDIKSAGEKLAAAL